VQPFVVLHMLKHDSIAWNAAFNDGTGPKAATGFEIQFVAITPAAGLVGTPFVADSGSPVYFVDDTTASALTPKDTSTGGGQVDFRYAYIAVIDDNHQPHLCNNVKPTGVTSFGVHVQQ
jgi:hypothetical protein